MKEGHEPAAQRNRRRATFALVLLVVIVAALGGACGWSMWHRARLLQATYAPAPEGMVFVPPGYFQKGSDDPQADDNERPVQQVFLPAFYIDRTEVTNAEYLRFDPTHSFPAEKRDFPVVKCLKADAQRYAAWAGKRLPTSDEWEKAARGTAGRLYPWGNTFDPAKANIGGRDSMLPVGSFPAGASPYGALDMAGNAWEWVSDTYIDQDRLGVAATRRGIIRGGAFGYSTFQGRSSHIGFESDDLVCGDLGFRCVKDAPPLPRQR